MLNKITNFLRWNNQQNLLVNLVRSGCRLVIVYIVVVITLHAPFIIIGNIAIASRDKITDEWVHHGETREIIRLAKEGDTAAIEKLAALYEEGNGGISPNHCRALNWFEKGARKGSARSQLKLAEAYFYGDGFWENDELAYFWSKYAEKNGADLSKFEWQMQYLEAELPLDVRDRWNSFEPTKQLPAQIYDGPYLALLEESFFIPISSCKTWRHEFVKFIASATLFSVWISGH